MDGLLSPDLPLVLGSGSPRRREILQGLAVPHVVVAGDADESRIAGESAEVYVSRVCRAKLDDVAARLAAAPRAVAGLLVADTIVVVDGEVLGKPRDVVEAGEMLGRLAGRTHRVLTAFALAVAPELGRPVVARTEETRVTFRAASPDELRAYAATGEGLDKAGAYAAQGIGAFLLARIEGSYSNVVGLPACEVIEALRDSGILGPYPRSAG